MLYVNYISVRLEKIELIFFLVVCKFVNHNIIVEKPQWLSVLLLKGGKSSIYFGIARCDISGANRENCKS